MLGPGARISQHIDARDAEPRFAAHQEGREEHGYALWAVWVLERWLQRAEGDHHVQPFGPPPREPLAAIR